MTSLLKSLRVHQVFGANTDVGKTLLTSALVRSSAAQNKQTFYLKPVSTGADEDADDAHVNRYTKELKHRVHTHCLYRYNDPVSPHLAARMGNRSEDSIPSNDTLVKSISNYIERLASRATSYSHMYVETAGGVHSPTLAGQTQLDAYRPLLLPTLLVGDSRLGGISSTISAYESLHLRGYTIDALLLFREEYYRNYEYLAEYFAAKDIKVFAFDLPPEKILDNAEANFQATDSYYATISGDETMNALQAHLDSAHSERFEQLDNMPQRTLDTVWWPFVQHGTVKKEDVMVIDSAFSDNFSVYAPPSSTSTNSLEHRFDGSASWWTQTLGHAHPELTLAAAHAAGRYGHVMFPKATHLPALQLAERLVHDGPGKGWASRAFFSDNGSTGMEVALKMALRAYVSRHGPKDNLGVLGLVGSYHGDTIGAMNACQKGVYTCEWHDARGYWLDAPTVAIRDAKVVVSLPESMASEYPNVESLTFDSPEVETGLGQVYAVEERLQSDLAKFYAQYIRSQISSLKARGDIELAALVLEPVVMGAGGMLFVDPLFQRILVDVVRGPDPRPTHEDWSGLPVIFDEVFVGLYRLGVESTTSILGVQPDIAAYAKILTGGLLPLCVTLASNPIFQAFWSENKTEALLHGHSYTAHPIGCAVANKTLDLIEDLTKSEGWAEAKGQWVHNGEESNSTWSFWDPRFVQEMSKASAVEEVMTMGTVLAIKVKDSGGNGYSSQSAEAVFASLKRAKGDSPAVNFRTLGDVAYFMTSLNTTSGTIRALEDRIWTILCSSG